MSTELWDTAPGNVYESSKKQIRKDYEKTMERAKDHKRLKQELGKMMQNISQGISFEVNIGNNEDKRLAFTQALRNIYSGRYGSKKVVVKAHTIDDNYKWFMLRDRHDMESTIGHIAREISLTDHASDTNPYISGSFMPIKYELLFLAQQVNERRTKYTTTKLDQRGHAYEETVELDKDYRAPSEGGVFPYINLSSVDLTQYQIFSSISPKNYTDNCFVYACIQSGVFSADEITHLRFFVQTKTLPNNKILEISREFQ